MEPFVVHVLGCGSATPTPRHNASAQVVEVRGKLFLVDCAEGTQIQLRRSRLAMCSIHAVFISHLHGDHCFGLIGLISTFGLLGRQKALHVYAPAALEKILQLQIEMFCYGLEFEVVFHAVDTKRDAVVYEDRSLTVTTIPLCHRVPCAGFLFREKEGLPHIRRDMIDFYHIPVCQINNIKAGADWVIEDGTVVPHASLVTPADKPRAYAYCSDTRYIPTLHEQLSGVDLLYHESTYGDDQMANAEKYCHSTARQAAMVAREAGVGRLMLGHYSARYPDETVLLAQAQEVFSNTILSDEGMHVSIG